MVKKTTKKATPSAKSQDQMLIQEQTFGMDDQYDDYNLVHSDVRGSVDKSYSVSDTSTRLKPVQYFSQKSV